MPPSPSSHAPPALPPRLQTHRSFTPAGARQPDIPSPIASWSPFLAPHAGGGGGSGGAGLGGTFRPYAAASRSTTNVAGHGGSRSVSYHPPSSANATVGPSTPAPGADTLPSRSTTYTPGSLAPPPAHHPQAHRDPHPIYIHRHSRSDVGSASTLRRGSPDDSEYSFESYSYDSGETAPTEESLSAELSALSLSSTEGIRRFQVGALPAAEDEWQALVPPPTIEALGKHETQRQCVIFEVLKGERDYLNDLTVFKEVFISSLRDHEPSVMPADKLDSFVNEVAYNLDAIITHHRRMLQRLYDRQLDQHPIIHGIGDIILDATLKFRDDYEKYIKHFKLAEARHRAELKKNLTYQNFLRQQESDLRTRRHGFQHFLSRPVHRLPKFKLLLESLERESAADHPDAESLQIVRGVLDGLMRATQPGLLAAEQKAAFWDVAESLVFARGEIIDMDMYDEKRFLIYSESLARRQRSETDWSGWQDYHVALLDNYLLITREEKREELRSREDDRVVHTRRFLVSRPIPLDYLRLGSFMDPPENRRDGGASSSTTRLLTFRSGEQRAVWPLTVYHAAARSTRRYTLFAPSEASRAGWRAALDEALALRRISQDANRIFAPHPVVDGAFRGATPRVPQEAGMRFTGRVVCASAFAHGGRRFLVVGTLFGIWVGHKGMPTYQKALPMRNPALVTALEDFNKLIILHNTVLYACSLSALAELVQRGESAKAELDASLQRVSSSDEQVLLYKIGKVANRTLIFYVVKGRLQPKLRALELVNVEQRFTTRREAAAATSAASFRPYGDEAVSIPKDVHNLSMLAKTVAICGEKGILVCDPTSLSRESMTVVPDFRGASNNLPLSNLKMRCESAKLLGIVKCGHNNSELMVIYDELACYVTKHGVPCRSSGYVRWETKASAFAHRGRFILLFSPGFVEVREIGTGRLAQVIAADDVHLLPTGVGAPSAAEILFAAKGEHDDAQGASEKIVELLETSEIERTGPAAVAAHGAHVWDEWDMAG